MYYSVKRFSVVGFTYPYEMMFSSDDYLTERLFNKDTKRKYKVARTDFNVGASTNKVGKLDSRIDEVVNSMKKHGFNSTDQLTGRYKNWISTSPEFGNAVMSRLTGQGSADSQLLADKSKGLAAQTELLADRVTDLSKSRRTVATEGGLDIKNKGGYQNLNVRLNNDGSASTEGARTVLEGSSTSSIRTKGDKRRARQAWNANNNQMRINVIQSKGGRKKVRKANLITQLGEAPAPNKPNGLGVEDIYTSTTTPNRTTEVTVKPSNTNNPVEVVRKVETPNPGGSVTSSKPKKPSTTTTTSKPKPKFKSSTTSTLGNALPSSSSSASKPTSTAVENASKLGRYGKYALVGGGLLGAGYLGYKAAKGRNNQDY